MATNQDTPISLLDPHPSPLSGSEIFPLTQSGQTVNALLSEIKIFITSGIPVGTGDITGSGTSGNIPLFNAAKNIVNSRITQTLSSIKVASPIGTSFLEVQNGIVNLEMFSDGKFANLLLDDAGRAIMSYDDGIGSAYLQMDQISATLSHNNTVELDAPNISISQLTANTVPYLDGSKVMRSSDITPTKLSYIGTARSDLQVQIDAVTSGLSWKQEVVCATTANITLSGLQTIDTYTVVVGDRVLVKNQSTASQNGIYIVASGAWTRATDCDSTSEMVSATVQVRFGAASPTGNKDTQWSCSNTNQPVIGTDAITFVQINGGATYTNGAGLTLSGNVFSIGAGQVVNSMLAGNIDLTTKVTAVLPYANGGTNTSTAPTLGSLPYAGATSYEYDLANYNYDSALKVLKVGTAQIGDSIYSINLNGGLNGGLIYAEGDGLKIYTGGRGIVLDSETAAIHILKGHLRCEPNKGVGKTFISDADGIITLQTPSPYAMPSVTYASTTTTNTDTNIIISSISGNTLTTDKDKLVYDFVIGNTGGTTGEVTYKVKINSTSLGPDKTVTLNTTSDPITLRVTIERLSSSSFKYTLQYNFSTHTTSLRTVEYNTVTGFDFTSSSTLYIIGNQLETGRAISGIEGHGVYYKAA